MALENPKQNIIDIAGAYGFIMIDQNSNPVMLSFTQEEDPTCRINYYFTTGTVQLQFKKNLRKPKIHRNVSLSQLEDILTSI